MKVVYFFVVLILTSLDAGSKTIDFRYSSDYCKEHFDKEEEIKFKEYIDKCSSGKIPKVINRKKIQSIEHVVNGLNTALLLNFSHGLNQHYINNMITPFYQRLLSAKRVGTNFSQLKPMIDFVQNKCQKNNYSHSIKLITMVFDEVKVEYEKFNISPMDKSEFEKKIIVAVFELDRLERVNKKILDYKEKNLKKLSEHELNELNSIYASNLKVIIRIQYNYPVLEVAHFDFSSRKLLEISKELYVKEKENFLNSDRVFYGKGNLEQSIDLIPSGQREQELPIPFFMKNESTPDRYKNYYENFYQKILNPKYKVPKDIVSFLEKATDVSMNQYFESLMRKCEDNNPCRSLATDPSYAAHKMSYMNLADNLAPLACLCRIEYNQESVSGAQNLVLGLGSAGGIILAILFPESIPIVWSAYGVNGVGVLTSAMGIYDGIVNENSSESNAINRSGGAVLESGLLNTLNSEYQAKFEKNYNNITGLIGMIPPGKIAAPATHMLAREIMKSKAFVARASKEAVLASTVAPAPDLDSTNYFDEWNPRKVYAPISIEFRNNFPALSKNLDHSMSNKVISDNRENNFIILNELKKAAGKMLSHEDGKGYLERGIILKKYLPENLKNLDLPFIQ